MNINKILIWSFLPASFALLLYLITFHFPIGKASPPGNHDFRVNTYHTSEETWEKTYGGSESDVAYAVRPVPGQNKFVATGVTQSLGHGYMSVLLFQFDASGHLEWCKGLGSDVINGANDMLVTDQSRYLIVGLSQPDRSRGSASGDVYVTKVNRDGEIRWERTYGGSARDGATSVIPADDGGYIVSGITQSYGSGGKDVFVLCIDEQGKKNWQMTSGGEREDASFCSVNTGEGGYIIGGSRTVQPERREEGEYVYLMRVNTDGEKEWDQVYTLGPPSDYGGRPTSRANAVVKTAAGNFLIAGWTDRAEKKTGFFLKIDGKGNVIWKKKLDASSKNKLIELTKTKSGYVACGKKLFTTGRGWDGYLLKVDSEGDIEWSHTHGQKSDGFFGNLESFHSILLSQENQLVVAGKNERLPETEQSDDAYVLKLTSGGRLRMDPDKSTESSNGTK
jgi:hypothetical protein